MDSKKKNIIAIAAVAVLVLVIAVIVIATCSNKSDDTNSGSTVANTVSVQETTVKDSARDDADAKDQATTKKTSKKDKKNKKDKNDKETNYWDNISIIEETQKSEPKTNKKGEIVTEEYPGQDDGWSPIVSPDDLDKE